ncbi:MAG: histidine--tRNA ligase, partial [Candidatus Omnitrophota bacterium]
MSGTLKYKSLRGMPDILPKDACSMHLVEERARTVFRMFGYDEIRTPVLEETGVFTRSIGADTDIVEKEMYSFTDRSGTSISLRPEGTAAVIRAYIEHGWHNAEGLTKLFYSGPMFRGERPQKGRQRQFHQIGVEAIGGSDPYIDAEIISSIAFLLTDLGVSGFSVLLSSLGCARDRESYQKKLASYLSDKSSALCGDCSRRMKKNVLRVLDCKKEKCRSVISGAPDIREHLCTGCAKDYSDLKNILHEEEISFHEKKDMVRGLDYYTGAIFEITHPLLGAQSALAAGGRYDGLVKKMGGPDVGAAGYALGTERLLLVMNEKGVADAVPGALVLPVDNGARTEAFRIAAKLRAKGVPCEMDHSVRSFKGRMRKAHKDGRKTV